MEALIAMPSIENANNCPDRRCIKLPLRANSAANPRIIASPPAATWKVSKALDIIIDI
jgi:hypothetical protein